MAKSLVIVESPAKARTINRFLGDDFIVKSSVGHVRDLPTGGGSRTTPAERAKEAAKTRAMEPEARAKYREERAQRQLIRRIGVDPDNGWEATYEILPGREKVISELKSLAAKADRIYLATDLDREGEAIAWHLKEVIGGDPARYDRVVFNEITEKAIAEAFENPVALDMNQVQAQQARRFLDRVVGFMLSPLLWSKIARGLSAGRVQSVAVELVVEREREIRAFVPDEYWELHTDTKASESDEVRLQVDKHAGEKYRPDNEKDAKAHEEALTKLGVMTVVERKDKPTTSRAPAPFITSTLQQTASNRLGFGVKKTMMLAQRLYEAGHITYMRTDSTNLSSDAVTACRKWISAELGDQYLPEKPNFYSSREGAQEAHEAIRPSQVSIRAELLKDMEPDARRLYELIRNRFIACQLPPARYLASTITAQAGEYELKANGRIMQFDGWTRVMPQGGKDTVLPDLNKGDQLSIVKIDNTQHFTKPPARYNEASLVRELEKRGIGRPSTYASIISTIQDRGYVRTEARRFFAEKMGDIVTERLVESFADLMDYDFTARMEETLDKVGAGEVHWRDALDEFYHDFKGKLEKAKADADEGGMRSNTPTETNIECPNCGRHMQIRTASTGVFLGCSGYSLPPKERCTQTMNLTSGDEAIDVNDEDAVALQHRQRRRCAICNVAMDSYLLDEKRKLHICGNNPDCPGYEVEEGTFRIKGYEGETLECDKCSSEMQLRDGRFGKYFKCTNEECTNTRKLLRSGKPAPPKADPIPMPHLKCATVDDHYLLRDGAAGIFLAASQFPKNRETRAPLVEEILTVKEQLDPKFAYLAEAPTADDKGNKTVIRFRRKTGEHYVRTEVDGKPTGWTAEYNEGKWAVASKAKAPAKRKKAAAKKKAAPKKKAAAKKKAPAKK